MWNFLFSALNLFPVKRRHIAAFKRYGYPLLRGRVLDIGSGKQPYRDHPEVTQYVSVDLVAGAKNPPSVIGNAMLLPFAHDSVDVALCTEVLEHLPDPLRCVEEIYRILKPGAKVYLTAPMTWQLHYVPHDYFRFTCYGLQELCRRSGLEVEVTFPIGRGVFATTWSRLADVLVCRFYRLLKPVEWVAGLEARVRLGSILLALPVLLLDLFVDLLDRLIPSDDHIAWGLIAVKPEKNR